MCLLLTQVDTVNNVLLEERVKTSMFSLARCSYGQFALFSNTGGLALIQLSVKYFIIACCSFTKYWVAPFG